MKKYFGTDGIRNQTNTGTMTCLNVMKYAAAVGHYYNNKNNKKNIVVIGKDTRLSGYMIEAALISGFNSVGIDVLLVGPVPTPSIPFLVNTLRADFGVMISASHNPYMDNGLKLFGRDGFKIDDDVERKIEELMDGDIDSYFCCYSKIGTTKRISDVSGRYIEKAKETFDINKNLNDFKIVLDVANGAAYNIAPRLFEELGAKVVTIHNQPNGYNINENCGATSPDSLVIKVLEEKADIGFAFDGDADRLIVVNEKGGIVNGDQIIALIAKNHKQSNKKIDKVVTTVMSNLGFEKYLNSIGIGLIRANVGDKYVVEQMRKHNVSLGGEQSGHIITFDNTTTGDGIISALEVCNSLVDTGAKASEICNLFDEYPQKLTNIKLGESDPLKSDEFLTILNDAEKNIVKEEGRILVRKSGTEPIIRIMVEAKTIQTVNKYSELLATGIKSFL